MGQPIIRGAMQVEALDRDRHVAAKSGERNIAGWR
jgi:hypothetical protein